MTTNATERVHPQLSAQREYGKQLALRGQDFALVAVEAFVRGIRDIGYKSSATALDELIDNSIQAGATRVDVAFGYSGSSTSKPNQIAIMDNGHGMDPEMIRASVMWGGTHREGDREGFGRYGYGLPSSCVSQGRRFTVYSVPAGGTLHKVTLDIEELGAGNYQADDGRVVVPAYEQANLPQWLEQYRKQQEGSEQLESGTIVVIDRLDRLNWVTATALERNLMQHFGLTYRNNLRAVELYVNGKQVEPIDPLFVTEGFRHFGIDEDRAEPLEPVTINVKQRGSSNSTGSVNVRFSWLPPTFASKDKSKRATRGNANPRLAIMKEHLGLIVMRAGRQIDVVSRCDWTQFQNNDRYWNVEIDFSPSLDEEFSITTSKQQVVLSDRMWNLLKEAGVYRAIEDMRRRWKEEASIEKDKRQERELRDSEKVMDESEQYKTTQPAGDPVKRKQEAERHVEEEATRRAREGQIPFEEAKGDLLAEIKGHRYKVREERVPGGPFYRPEQMGGQFVLWLNIGHRFYTDVYAGTDSTPFLQAALELLLFTLGESELNSHGERRLFYRTERQALWTTRLSVLLELLSQHSGVEDDVAMEQEMEETSQSQAELALAGVASD